MSPHRTLTLPVLIMGDRNPNCAVICAASVSSRFADRYFHSSFLRLFFFFLSLQCEMRGLLFSFNSGSLWLLTRWTGVPSFAVGSAASVRSLPEKSN
jgi:hypothetical protein